MKMNDPTVKDVAKKHGVTPSQVLLRWGIQLGLVVLVKTEHVHRMKENLQVFGFELDKYDMAQLADLDDDLVTDWDPIKNDPV